MKRRRSRLLLAMPAVIAWGNVACSDGSGGSVVTPAPTLIEVSPAAFLGSVPCGEQPGTLRTYTATLTDVTLGMEEFRLPSSAPVDCTRSVVFGNRPGELQWLVPKHSYVATIQGYDRALDELVQAASGSDVLLDAATGAPVAPRWTTRCDPVRSESQLTRRVQRCEPLATEEPPGEASIEVVLPLEECAEMEPPLEEFVVRRGGEVIGRAPCGESVTVLSVPSGAFATLELLAYAADSEVAAAGTLCTAQALAGARVSAVCDELTSKGSISVAVESVVAALGVPCRELAELTLTLEEVDVPALRVPGGECRGVTGFGDLDPGPYTIVVQPVLLGSTVPNPVRCTAEVEPGLSATPVCSAAE